MQNSKSLFLSGLLVVSSTQRENALPPDHVSLPLLFGLERFSEKLMTGAEHHFVPE